MDNEQLENKINELSNRIDEKDTQIEELTDELRAFKDNPLTVNIDQFSRETIQQVISDDILNIIWEDVFLYSTFIESIDRYLQNTNSGGTVSLTSNGLVLTLGTGSTSIAGAELDIFDTLPNYKILDWSKRIRFRTKVTIDDVSSSTLFVTGPESLLDGVSFEINQGTILGRSQGNGNITTLNLGSVASGAIVNLEYDYNVDKVDFYVNGKLSGTITENMPRKNITVSSICSANFEKTATTGAGREARIIYFDVIQKK